MSHRGRSAGFDHEDADAVVAFVDMAGYTALTEVHGDHQAAELAERFAELARSALGAGDELIKTIGDAVMAVFPNGIAALAFLRRLTDATGNAGGFPMLRAGVSDGPVVRRRGDVYGATVNTAARLAAAAAPGQILTTIGVADAARNEGLAVNALGPTILRNIATPIAVFAISSGAEAHRPHVDPVCRMHVADHAAVQALAYRGRTYRFCSTTCATQFSSRPHNYARMRLRDAG